MTIRGSITRLLAGLLAAGVLTGQPGTTPGAEAQQASTTVTLAVEHCAGCRLQAVQTDAHGKANTSYISKWQRVRDDSVTFVVPTRRTHRMSFLLDAPFDDYGLPVAVVIGYKSVPAGTTITDEFAGPRRVVSSCWSGTSEQTVTDTLVVTRHPGALAYNEGHGTVVGAYLQQTLPAQQRYVGISDAAYHVSEALMCFDKSKA